MSRCRTGRLFKGTVLLPRLSDCELSAHWPIEWIRHKPGLLPFSWRRAQEHVPWLLAPCVRSFAASPSDAQKEKACRRVFVGQRVLALRRALAYATPFETVGFGTPT